MKFSASAIIVLMLIVSMLALAASADKHRQLKSRKGKGNKSSKKQPQPPGPQPQCETVDLYVLLNYDNECVKVANPFEGRQTEADSALGWSEYRAIYGPPDEDGFFTDPPIGIKFETYQNGPAIPEQDGGGMDEFGWYKLAAGFMLDPTPTRFVAAPDTLYRSSVWYQAYTYSDIDSVNFYAVNRLPILGGSGKYACAVGEVIVIPVGTYCSYDIFRLRICNTCPDPDEDYE